MDDGNKLLGDLALFTFSAAGYTSVPDEAQHFLYFLPLPQEHGSFLPGRPLPEVSNSLVRIQLITLAGARRCWSSEAMNFM